MNKTVTINPWLLSVVLFLVAVLSVTPFMDQRAAADYEQLFQRAFVTFALARTINGVISVVQGTEIALQPAGVGVTLTPGEILDPVNDLVERFSWVMMGATISLGVQNVLLDVSAWWVIQALVTLLAAWLLIRVWYPGQGSDVTRAILKRVFLLVLFIRFAVPVMLIANDLLYQQFLEERFQQSTEIITVAGRELEQLSEEKSTDNTGDDETGMLNAITRAWSSTVDTVDLSGRIQRMQAQAAQVIEHIIQLSVVFILQTALLPVAFLWFFVQVVKRLFRPVKLKAVPE
ncbi:MAG: hypothetical protein OEU84_09960 [Xanthomonadales bacterium]|nr:hypothetical protein [Xanthomonadales bacterium]MDH4019910.1 hypothetical protein [Xanthomonadales bacterium]